MRLAHWSLHPVRLPYRVPIEWSDMTEAAADLLLLRVVDADGREGLAEGTAKPTWSGHTLRSLAATLDEVLLPRLKGIDIADATAAMRAFSRVPEQATAKAMVDAALCDLLDETPPPAARSIALSWTVTLKPAAEMAAEAEDMIARYGFRTLKLKGGKSFAEDIAAARAVRAAVGSDVTLTIDCNGLHAGRDGLEAHLAALAEIGLTHIEDPVSFRPDASFAALQAASPVPLIVDAAIWSEADCAPFLGQGARAFGVKPGRVGPTATTAIARHAAADGAETMVGLFGESDLGAGATWRLAAGLPPASLPAETSTFLLFDRPLTREPPTIRDGRVAVPATRAAERADWAAIARLHP